MGSAKSVRLTTAQAIIRYLYAQHLEDGGSCHRIFSGMFGIFGHGNVAGIGQALEQDQGLRYYQARNEQGMVHAAIAYAKQNRRKKMFACTSSIGPGATNMITGAATATINRLPVLLLPGDTFAGRTQGPVLQQLEQFYSPEISVNECFRPVSAYWSRISRPEQLLLSLPEAIKTLLSPARTGAVTLALPQDTQTEAWDFPRTFFEPLTHRIARPRPDLRAVQETLTLLRQAKRPFIIAGGGIRYSEAEKELAEFSRICGIPVGESQAGKGSLGSNEAFACGAVGVTGTLVANRLAESADLVLFAGCRMSDFTTASGTQFQNPDVRFVGLNIHECDAGKFNAVRVEGDARESLRELLAACREGSVRTSESYQKEISLLRRAWEEEMGLIMASKPDSGLLSQAALLSCINEELKENDTVVGAAGGLPGDMHKLLNLNNSDQYHMEYGYSCMGYEVAGGLGVRLAKAEGEVFVLTGDGSYLMLHSELLTAIQEDQKIIVVISDNHGFRCIHHLSESCGSQGFGNEFRRRNPEDGLLSRDVLKIDFVRYAEALGARTFQGRSIQEIKEALKAARASLVSCVIVVETDPSHRVPAYASRWNVPVAEVSTREGVQNARKIWENNFSQKGSSLCKT